ncbi:hypothetical protein [Streptomyces vinaceus]|uniref:hypothetical protein n=1 Tax=Streptomyces vinaceus TaxID=1960 RepID=UPI0037F38BD4
MSKFPDGPFTIVNQETGRCVRVRLGETVDVSDYKEGTKYLQYVSYKPTLEIGPDDGSPATSWFYRSHDDPLERQPFDQIASAAVTDLQNIGDYGVWMYSDPAAQELEKARLQEWYASRLNDAAGKSGERLDALIPEAWTAQAAQDYEAELAYWKGEGEQYEGTVEQLNGRQAMLLEELRPQHGKIQELIPEHLDLLLQTVTVTRSDGKPMTRQELQESLQDILVSGARQVQAIEQKMERAEPQRLHGLLREQVSLIESGGAHSMKMQLEGFEVPAPLKEAVKAAMETERALVEALKAEAPVRAWQRRAPLKGVARWNDRCTQLAFYGKDQLDGVDSKFAEEMTDYLKTAAKEGITKPVSNIGSRTELFGCGAKRYRGSTYRWSYDGTYISASDSQTVPSEQTYWTDDDGQLVGKSKGHPGQKWKIAPYKAPAKPPVDAEEVFLTGMFGPIGSIFRRA